MRTRLTIGPILGIISYVHETDSYSYAPRGRSLFVMLHETDPYFLCRKAILISYSLQGGSLNLIFSKTKPYFLCFESRPLFFILYAAAILSLMIHKADPCAASPV